ncbi:sodium-translocating pyrophosphatase [Treponema denticola]|uniref:Putative K(+)-stimulated pyrophosphate-energized sodium pump n=2 Tax=Treponema denticola TaxID=158 RepID=M2CM22_TREDN|nr:MULTISPECIES: sodium-translocating pyrophosphatase [Treponema]EMB26787.1 V-type H(+)-translocating pyrophosphatase [Treponema denticola MYR-T]EMB31683.1 V-type H(+)-translocating pyrophosphatase [Treponema denticola H-22]EMB34613.1 V-type H(+)-translocating pyrophosphatase [Treponema denticola H1-T]EMB34767.1 V-type H(+)-translocating pyrophosphatase [Treponema denticola ATCC 35404]EMB35599.1 V-type H(+)-translocating pyrophosphatase [Treponema denticola ATCC 33521]
MSISLALYAVLGGGIVALAYALVRTLWIYKQKVSDQALKEIGGHIADGAMAFLRREYITLLPFIAIVAVFLAIGNKGALKFQSLSFLLGALASMSAGYIGMRVATQANSRTTQAAKDHGLNGALKVAFSGGSVMGMSVVGLAFIGLFIVLILSTSILGTTENVLKDIILPLATAFSLGASSIALFSRVGGGIYTKAADVGADLVGKVEAGIPEDDPRNPATIADNVGDNVGDVAGMGADLFESFVGSLVGAMILGLIVDTPDSSLKLRMMLLPLLISVVGLAASLIGTFFVRAKPGSNPQKALNTGTFGAALIATIFVFFTVKFVMGTETFNGTQGYLHVFASTVIGLAAGVLIGIITEFYTGTGKKPVKGIVDACETGAATTIISGLAVGMRSAFPVMILIGASIFSSFMLAGLYGVGIAAVGMLVTLGIQLAVDAYGPIADNAGGLAEMANFPKDVRNITDSLDAVGNTTAAIGKGFAIGSAALTAIILFTSFKEQAGVASVDITNINVLVGVLLGGVFPFLFSALTMSAVGKAAHKMIEEVRRQFKQHPGILENTEKPDYKRCVDISTQAALKEMVIPGIAAIITPILVGFAGGPAMLIGLLTGVTVSGVVLAVFMSNAGGAWDNAKKMIEGGIAGGKGSPSHKAAVVGDTVGDPFKDTSGPSINILIKLMSMVSLVIAPMLKIYWG